MVSRTDSHTKSFDFLQTARTSNVTLLNQQSFFTNHQKWQISRHLDCEASSFIFHLKDPYGISYEIKEFIVEDLDPNFRNRLTQLNSAEEQQKIIHQYLQEQLNQATFYQVHIERHGNKTFIRFGDYGLKGGVTIDELEKEIDKKIGKKGACILSAAQIGCGVLLKVFGGDSGKMAGGILITTGLATGTYAVQTNENEKKYKNKEYVKHFGFSLIAGAVSGVVGFAAGGAETMLKLAGKTKTAFNIGSQALNAALGFGASTTISEIAEKREKADLKAVGKKTLIAGLGGGIGAATGSLVHAALTNEIANGAGEMVNNLMSQFPRYSKEVAASFALTLKKMAESGFSSGSSKFTTDLCENLQEDEASKKKDLSTLGKEACQSAVISALISGVITALEQKQKIQKYNETKSQMEQTQKELEDAQAAKAKSESSLQGLQKTLKQSEQNLVEKQKALKLQEQSLQEKRLQQQKAQERIEKDQQAINEAQKIANIAEKELCIAQQSLMEAQQQVDKHHQAISEAQKIASVTERQLRTATQIAQEVQQAHAKRVAVIDKDIRRHLKQGFKAKIKGHHTKNKAKIREAYLQGKIEWEKGGGKEKIRMNPSPLMEKYQQAQEHGKQTEQKIQKLQSSVNQKQTELKTAEGKLNLHRQAVDQTQAELKAAQEVQLKQAELKIVQEQLGSYQGEIQQAQQDMIDIQGAIKTLEQQTSQFETKIQEELKKLQAILSKESGLTTLSKEQQAAIHKAQQDYDKSLRKQVFTQNLSSQEPSKVLKNALKPDPVIRVEADCSLEELIPHVVLVQALKEDTYAHYFSQIKDETIRAKEWEACQLNPDKSFYCLKGVITPTGVIGHHLQLEKREFEGSLEYRPHMHWCWNQLVQPHSLGGWEDAKIAVLEPLSTFESDIYYKPFGVAPYDTFTFSSHRLSEKAVLLVPESILSKAQAYLPAFRDRIMPFKGALRPAIIDALQAYYPNAWHVCDEKGNLIGKETRYSVVGYSSATCLKAKDGRVIILLRNEGLNETNQEGLNETSDLHSTAFKDYHKSKRFIGLHTHAATVWIEDNPYFKTLTRFKEDHKSFKDNPLFAGNIKDIHGLASLGVLEALKLYHRLLRFNGETGAIGVANYIINEAIYADLVSLFYQMNPDSRFDLCPLDIKLIFASTRDYLLNLLENIQKNLESKDPDQRQQAMKFFAPGLDPDLNQKEPDFIPYCTILKKSLSDIQKAKKEALRLIKLEKEGMKDSKLSGKIPLCLLVAKDEWEKIVIPHSIEFDLGKNWPHGALIDKYINKVLRTLSDEQIKLQQLYRQLSSSTNQVICNSEEQKEQYRINIICSLIQWVLQEKIYLESRGDYHNSLHSSILLNKLSKQIGWLAEYCLEAEDFTSKIGDCLFDNIVAQLPSSRITSLQLRKDIVQYMRERGGEYSDKPDYNDNELLVGDGTADSFFFENWVQYLACMSKPQVWGTELEIKALAFHLDCPIALLTVNMKPKIYNCESKNIPLLLHHVHTNHYEACFPRKGLTVNDVYHPIIKLI